MKKETWNWYRIGRLWCEIIYSAKSVSLSISTSSADYHHCHSMSPESAERLGKTLIKAANKSRKLAKDVASVKAL